MTAVQQTGWHTTYKVNFTVKFPTGRTPKRYWTVSEAPVDPYPKTTMNSGEAWANLISLYENCAADPTEENRKHLKHHLVWHGGRAFREIPDDYDVDSMPPEFWIEFRSGVEWGTVTDLFQVFSQKVLEDYLYCVAPGGVAYSEDFKYIYKLREDMTDKQDKWLYVQYNHRQDSMSADEVVEILQKVSSFKGSYRIRLRKTALYKKKWDGQLPAHVKVEDFSPKLWNAVLDVVHVDTLAHLLKTMPSSYVSMYFSRMQMRRSIFRIRRDISLVGRRDEHADTPAEWLEGLYLN